MKRDGIVNTRCNSFLLQRNAQLIATRNLHDIDIVNMCCPWSTYWHRLNKSLKCLSIARGMGLTCCIPGVQIAQFHPQYCRLQFIHPRIDSQHLMLIAHTRAVITQYTETLRKGRIISDTDTRFPIGTQIFTVIEAKTADISQAPHTLTVIGCAMGLRGILNYPQTMHLCEI